MIHRKVLIIAPYPIVKPRHGGQKRVRAMYDFYKTVFREVKFVGVFHRGQYAEKGVDDLWLGNPDIIAEIDKNSYASEIIQGESIDKDIHVRSYMAEYLREYKPDIIQVEQAFPYLGLKPLLEELNLRPRIVLSSHNVEFQMKQEIYKELKLPTGTAQAFVSKTKQLEIELARKADLVIAVSEQDATFYRSKGANNCVVAPNGIEKSYVTRAASEKWQAFKKDMKISEALVFVGSGHPPNWVGYIDSLGDDSSFLGPKTKILIAGGVADYFKDKYRKKSDKFWTCAKGLGQLNEDDLTGLISIADIMLLPMTSGGGSNLKTAEAILSGKKIVATSFAFRGFESYLRLPNIYISDSQKAFKNTITKAISATYIERTNEEVKIAEQVQWINSLKPIVPKLSQLARKSIKQNFIRKSRAILSLARSVVSQ